MPSSNLDSRPINLCCCWVAGIQRLRKCVILVCKNLHAYREAENESHLLTRLHFSQTFLFVVRGPELQHLKHTCCFSSLQDVEDWVTIRYWITLACLEVSRLSYLWAPGLFPQMSRSVQEPLADRFSPSFYLKESHQAQVCVVWWCVSTSQDQFLFHPTSKKCKCFQKYILSLEIICCTICF